MTEDTNARVAVDSALPVAGANFESQKVQIINDDTLRIKPTVGSLAFGLMFVLLGVVLAGLWVISTFSSFDGPGSVPLMLIGVLFTAAGIGMYYSSNQQLVIDRAAGVAFVRSWHPSVSLDATSLFRHIQPHDIKAIQTVSRVVKHRTSRGKRRSSYTEYQVNVCVADEVRHNMFVTLKSEKAEELALLLVKMFDVPLQAH